MRRELRDTVLAMSMRSRTESLKGAQPYESRIDHGICGLVDIANRKIFDRGGVYITAVCAKLFVCLPDDHLETGEKVTLSVCRRPLVSMTIVSY